MSEKVSVVIPVYNTENYLTECIKSVRAQTYPNLEILLINDGSTDGSLNICRWYASQDDRIRVIDQPNSGVSMARNAGIEASTGEYITFIDSDDMVAPQYCQHLVEKMVAEVSMVVHGIARMGHDGRKELIQSRLKAGIYRYEELARIAIDDGTLSGFTFYSACAILFRRSVIQKNKLQFIRGIRYNEDGLFSTEYLLMSHGTVVADPAVGEYYYRTNPDSATKRVDLLGKGYASSMRMVEDELLSFDLLAKEAGIQRQLQLRRNTIALDTMIYLARKGRLSSRMIRSLLKDAGFHEAVRYLNVHDMKPSKKIVYWALRGRLYPIVAGLLNQKYREN